MPKRRKEETKKRRNEERKKRRNEEEERKKEFHFSLQTGSVSREANLDIIMYNINSSRSTCNFIILRR